jgi:hypothetical protein
MTGEELVVHLAKDCGQPQDIITDVLQALADTLAERLAAGIPVTIPGLATLSTFEGLGLAHEVKVQCRWTPELRARVTEGARQRAAAVAPRRVPGARRPGLPSTPVVAGPTIRGQR